MLLLVGCGAFTGCSDDDPEPPVNNGNDDPQVAVSDEIFYANCFGKDVLSQYYYWCDPSEYDERPYLLTVATNGTYTKEDDEVLVVWSVDISYGR